MVGKGLALGLRPQFSALWASARTDAPDMSNLTKIVKIGTGALCFTAHTFRIGFGSVEALGWAASSREGPLYLRLLRTSYKDDQT